MILRSALLLLATIFFVSCQFTETMVLNEDGSGRMAIDLNMDEMMAFGGMGIDTAAVKMDTIISIKQFLEEKKDSIATLSAEQQAKLKRMENYNIRMVMDSETEKMNINMYIDFKNVAEANDLMNGLNEGGSMMPQMGGTSIENKEEDSPEVVGVKYKFEGKKFKRDAYIIDKKLHTQQLDSMKSAEAFMSSMKYKLKYTFPKKIKKSSVKDATYSLDGKTIEVERSFLDYMKDPNILDLEVELESN